MNGYNPMGGNMMPAFQDQKGNVNLFGDLVICHTTQFGNGGGFPGLASQMQLQAMQMQLLEAQKQNQMLLGAIASIPEKLALAASQNGQKTIALTDTGEVIEAHIEDKRNSVFRKLGNTSIKVSEQETPSYDLTKEDILISVEMNDEAVPAETESQDSFQDIEQRKRYWRDSGYDHTWLDMSQAIDKESRNFKFEILKTIDEFGRTPLYGGTDETKPVWMVSTEENWRLSIAKAIKSYKSSVFKKTKFKEGVTPIIIFTFDMKTNNIFVRYVHPFMNGVETPDKTEFDKFIAWLSKDNPLYILAPRISQILCFYVPYGNLTAPSSQIMVEIDNVYELNNGKMGKIKISSDVVILVTEPIKMLC